MKLLKFLKKILILGAFTLALTSCQNNIFNMEEDKTPHLVISSSSRTAKPSFSMQDFDTIILTGTYNSEDYELGEWTTDSLNSAYDNLSKAYIPLPYTGNWSFTLNAIKTGITETETDADGNKTVIENRTLFSGSMEINITEGTNPIKFELDVVEYDTTGKGNIFVTLSLKDVQSDDVSNYTVKATLAPFSNQSNTTEYEVPLSNDGSDTSYASLNVENIASGIYLATFNVSKTPYSNVATKRIIITITNGVTSKIDSDFSLAKDDISNAITASNYTITYDENGGTWENKDYITQYNAYKDDTELPTSKDITKNGYTFQGWYKNEDSSQTIITKIPKGTRENLTLKAKWLKTEVVGTWKDNSRMFYFSDSGVYYGYTLNSSKYSYLKGTYSTSNDYIVISVEYEGIIEYDEEQTLSDISWKKLLETKYEKYTYTYDSSTEQLNLSFISSWANTSNDTYYFEQSGTTWKSNNQGRSSSTAKSTWTLEVPPIPIGVGAVNYSFYYSVSSENSYDKLTITLDDSTVVNSISGSISDSYTTTLSEGTHTITAIYSKDSSGNNYNDCGTITLNPVTVTHFLLQKSN